MKLHIPNKVLAVFGVAAWVLSVLSTVDNAQGEPSAPLALVVVSLIATPLFFIMATVRLWKISSIIAVLFPLAGAVLFVLQVGLVINAFVLTRGMVLVVNAAKITYVAVYLLVVIRLFIYKRLTGEARS